MPDGSMQSKYQLTPDNDALMLRRFRVSPLINALLRIAGGRAVNARALLDSGRFDPPPSHIASARTSCTIRFTYYRTTRSEGGVGWMSSIS